MTPVAPAAAPLPAAVAALHRAMPFTRLTDCGMGHADARELLAATAAGADWEDVAADLGERQHRRSVTAERARHLVTAREASRWATAAFMFAQMARNRDDSIKQSRYRRYVEALTRCAALQVPAIERVTLPYRGGHLIGWFCRPADGAAGATVMVWGGLSGWGAAYLPVADALTRRGLACLLAEGPGQGESRLVHGVYADTDITLGFARFIDAVRDDWRLDDRVGIQGNSFGGLFAALLASSDPRVDACVINGAPPAPRVPGFRSVRDQVLALLGTDDETRASDVLRQLEFDPRRTRITCPLLVLHGGADPLVTQDEQLQFIAGADPATSRLCTWADGEHTLYNYAAERNALTADWFADQLLP